MALSRQARFIWSFLALLTFCSVMVLRQFRTNQAQHIKLRESFILLHAKGYTNQALVLYGRLLREMDKVPNQVLFDDFQRTLMLVDPRAEHTNNLVWKYHWTISNEMEKRSEKSLAKAIRLAEQVK